MKIPRALAYAPRDKQRVSLANAITPVAATWRTTRAGRGRYELVSNNAVVCCAHYICWIVIVVPGYQFVLDGGASFPLPSIERLLVWLWLVVGSFGPPR